jgi:hypothetical protein
VRSPGTFAELVAHVSIKIPRPLGLSRTRLVLYFDGEVLRVKPLEQNTGPSTARSVVSHIAMPSPYR